MQSSPFVLKYPYRALELSSTDSALYQSYLRFKALLQGQTKKPGLVSPKEYEAIATQCGYKGKAAFLKAIGKLSSTGFLRKTKHGIELTSYLIIKEKLKLTNTNGKAYTPLAYVPLPAINDRIVEMMKLYLILTQHRTRKYYVVNGKKCEGIKTKNKSRIPESFSFMISLDTLMKKGNYRSKMTVSRLVDDLVKVKLIQLTRGKFNDASLQYDCNQYILSPLTKAKFGLLNVDNDNSTKARKKRLEKLLTSTGSHKQKIIFDKPMVKKKITLTPEETKFIQMLDSGLKQILIDNGHLSSYYLNRKVTKSMLPKLIAHNLNDPQLKTIFFKVFSPENVRVDSKEKTWVDPKAFVYERYHTVYVDQVRLVSTGGNYKGHPIWMYEEQVRADRERIRARRNPDAFTLI